MAVISPLELEHSAPGHNLTTHRYFVQWRRAPGAAEPRHRIVYGASANWRDVMCDVNHNGGSPQIEQARAVMKNLRGGRDPAEKIEWRILKRNFEVTAEVVE